MPNVIKGPSTDQAPMKKPYSKKHRGGPGVYDGEPGYPKRDKSSSGPPEKVRDQSPPFPSKK